MENKELICPVERIKKSEINIKIDKDKNDININTNIKIVDPLNKFIKWINEKMKQ